MIQRRVDLGRGRTWCARWWEHPEVAVRLDALRLAWYEMTAPGEAGGDPGASYSAWWVNHVDPTLDDLAGWRHRPDERLPSRPAFRQSRPGAAHRTRTPKEDHMTVPDDRVITVAFLREFLGLPASRPDGVRDLLVVPRTGRNSRWPGPWQLALGDWPETWRRSPSTAPRFLVVLHGLATPYFIAGHLGDRPARWGSDAAGDRGLRRYR